MEMEEVNPIVRIAAFVIIMGGVIFGGYYFLFHPIKVEPTETEAIVPSAGTSATKSTRPSSNSSAPQRYTTTTNKDRIKSYVSNVANSLKKKEVKKNPANYLIIDKIGVSAPLELVNFDGSGNMATPSGPNVVAYYSQGAKIGTNGNAVISGHRDTERGKAVFYRLSNLEVGDTVLVTDNDGKGYKYVVDSKNKYPKDSFPSKEIFSNGTTARLNLVTCAGAYDKNARTYSHRLVVSAVLAK